MRDVTKEVKRRYRGCVLQCRLKAGIAKQKELAERTGISQSILSDLESCRLFLSTPYALRIREVCGCTLDELYEEVGSSRDAV